ncbi:MAG: hypothetical protein JSS83_21140 [Cyanobacteria bacterium SZAS LIN-3]|nr:hypothetical protein [Cyanobacteria bacterium SZAS LIN-3]
MQLVEIGVKCPNCGIKFTSRQLPEVIDTGIRNSELRQHFGDVKPCYEHFTIATCPSCGRADWATSFPPTTEPCSLNQPQSPPHVQYRQAALGAERQGKNFYGAGLFYLHAAWCADDVGAIPQAREYRRLAADSLRKALVDVSCPLAHRAEIEYLVGELYRRAGDFNGCRDYYQPVIGRMPPKYALMARKIMRLAELKSEELIEFENVGG